MADLRSSFPSLEDASTGGGLALHKVLQGDALAAKNASAGLVARDAGNLLRYLLVDGSGALQVNTQGASLANLNDNAVVSGGTTYQTVVTIPLQAAYTYKNLAWVAGCYRNARFKIVLDDDGTPTTLVQGIITGPGATTDGKELMGFSFDSGASGVQNLLLQGINLTAVDVSDLSGMLSVDEVQP